ncbi:hypothetical protein Wcon_00102 [Wolbachia endosymbiont of Cylisticus convexus]|nr:hypothetical protein Wcon_00102 [Wolbachia endosymbiont of Cylisticus convexus]
MTNLQRTNYDFFELAHNLNSAVLVRASKDRTVNKKSRYPEQGEKKLWEIFSPCRYDRS